MANQTATPTARPRRFDDSPLAVVLVALGLGVTAALVILLWLPVASQARFAVEKYAPMTHGSALTYRVTNPDGSISYRSRNLVRTRANATASELPFNVFVSLLKTSRIDITQLSETLVLQALNDKDIILETNTGYDAQGNPRDDKSRLYFMLTSQALTQIGLDQMGLVPGVPLLPDSTAPQINTGKLNDQLAFTITQQIATRGAFNSTIGDLPDCLQVHASTELGGTTTTQNTWYCAGVGEVYDETTDAQGTRKSELVAASVGSFLRGSAPVLPFSGINATLRTVFPQPIAGALHQELNYKEALSSNGITTHIVPVNGLLLYGTQSGALVALDQAAEKQVWRFQTGNAIYSTPVVANGIAYFGSADKKVYAVRVADGAFVWAFLAHDIVSSSPAVANGTVYVSSEDRTLYALDADTGQPRWRFSTSGALVPSPVLDGGFVFIANDGGTIYALDAVTGSVYWTFSTDHTLIAPVTVADDVVYAGTFSKSYTRNVFALQKANGTLLWNKDAGDDVIAAPVVAQGRVYVPMVRELVALDAGTGAELWRYQGNRDLHGSPLVMGDQVWVLRSGDMLALNVATGAVTSQTPTSEGSVIAGCSSDGRALFIGFFDGTLKSFVGGTP